MLQVTYPDDDCTNGDTDTVTAYHHCKNPHPATTTGLIFPYQWVLVLGTALVSYSRNMEEALGQLEYTVFAQHYWGIFTFYEHQDSCITIKCDQRWRKHDRDLTSVDAMTAGVDPCDGDVEWVFTGVFHTRWVGTCVLVWGSSPTDPRVVMDTFSILEKAEFDVFGRRILTGDTHVATNRHTDGVQPVCREKWYKTVTLNGCEMRPSKMARLDMIAGKGKMFCATVISQQNPPTPIWNLLSSYTSDQNHFFKNMHLPPDQRNCVSHRMTQFHHLWCWKPFCVL